jgi:capsular polysaccharide biosynthesis protein
LATRPASFSSEESIDLRRIIESLLRRWRIIAAALLLSAILGFAFSFLVQKATYESSGTARLPVTGPESGLGLTPEGYLALAGSGPIIDSVGEQLGLELTSGQLRQRFRFGLIPDQTIAFTTSAKSAEQSFLLADTWLETYQRELKDLLGAQLDQLKAEAVQQTELLSPQLAGASEELTRYDLANEQHLWELKLAAMQSKLEVAENRLQELMAFSLPETGGALVPPIDLTSLGSTDTPGGGGEPEAGAANETPPQSLIPIDSPVDSLVINSDPRYIEFGSNLIASQLTDLERDLVTTQNRIRQLNLALIPIAESRLISLEQALIAEPELLGQPAAGAEAVPNPVYLALSQDRANTRILLDVERSEAATLSAKVTILLEQIDDLRVELLIHQQVEKNRSALAAARQEAEVLETTILELRPEIHQLSARVNAEHTARQELEGHLTGLQAEYDLARAELDRLFNLENSMASYSRLSLVQPPTQPIGPVPAQRTRNIALAMFLGLIIGVGAALLVDYYQGKPAPAVAPS